MLTRVASWPARPLLSLTTTRSWLSPSTHDESTVAWVATVSPAVTLPSSSSVPPSSVSVPSRSSQVPSVSLVKLTSTVSPDTAVVGSVPVTSTQGRSVAIHSSPPSLPATSMSSRTTAISVTAAPFVGQDSSSWIRLPVTPELLSQENSSMLSTASSATTSIPSCSNRPSASTSSSPSPLLICRSQPLSPVLNFATVDPPPARMLPPVLEMTRSLPSSELRLPVSEARLPLLRVIFDRLSPPCSR